MMKMNKNKKTKIVFIIVFLIFIALISYYIISKNGDKIPQLFDNAKKSEIETETTVKKYVIDTSETNVKLHLVFENYNEGIECIEFIENGNIIQCNGKNKVAVDYDIDLNSNLNFNITLKDGTQQNFTQLIDENFLETKTIALDVFDYINQRGETLSTYNITQSISSAQYSWFAPYTMGAGATNGSHGVWTANYYLPASSFNMLSASKMYTSAWLYCDGTGWVNYYVYIYYKDGTYSQNYIGSARSCSKEIPINPTKQIDYVRFFLQGYDPWEGCAQGYVNNIIFKNIELET